VSWFSGGRERAATCAYPAPTTIVVKPRVARISLTIAVILFFSGFFVLCDCPGWYALASAFAGAAVWSGAGRTRGWAVAFLISSLILTGFHTYGKIEEHRRSIERRRRLEQRHNKADRPRSLDSKSGPRLCYKRNFHAWFLDGVWAG